MSDSSGIHALGFLGRRVERLIFGGIFLIVLCFVETYLTTANRQLIGDHSANTVAVLLDHLKAEEAQLTVLFEVKPVAPKPRATKISQSTEKQKAINETRRLLGLPPPSVPHKPHKPQDSLLKQPTYKEALSNMVSELQRGPGTQRGEFERYLDPAKPPSELIKALQQKMKVLENSPTTVWGIQTPQLLQLKYAGLDYKFPFGFVSAALAIALAPLIIGWLGAFSITRQRELLLIAASEDYKLAFPHILNWLPVNFQTIQSRFQKIQTRKTQIIGRKLNRLAHAVFRSFVILLITLPLSVGFAYSLFQLSVVEANDLPFLFYIGFFMVTIMAFQTLNLVLYEWIILHKKEFHE